MLFSRFEIISSLAALLAVYQIVNDNGDLENSTLALLAAAAIGFVLPEIVNGHKGGKGLKRLKVGQFEAEFEERLQEFEEKVIKAEQDASSPDRRPQEGYPSLNASYVQEYERIISSPSSNREKVVLGGLLAERMAEASVSALEIDPKGAKSAISLVRRLATEGVVSNSEVAAFESFWAARNVAVHASGQELSDEQTTKLLDLLWRLVKVFG